MNIYNLYTRRRWNYKNTTLCAVTTHIFKTIYTVYFLMLGYQNLCTVFVLMLDSQHISLLFLSEIICSNLAVKCTVLFEPSQHHTEETLAKTTLANGRI
jgi:hypothetical protein